MMPAESRAGAGRPSAVDVSIIILNYNKSEMTATCLSYLWRNTTGFSYEIIVVDNGSDAREFERLAEIGGNFQILRLSVNRFFGEANNIAADDACGKYLVFLNNDVFVTPGWLEPMLSVLKSRPEIGAVGPRFLYPDGRLQEAGAFVDERGQARQVGKFGPFDFEECFTSRIVDYCSAACLAVPAEAFCRIAGYDLIYEPAYFEDVDLCLKLASIGLGTWYCADTAVFHIENSTSSAFRKRLGLGDLVEDNRITFLNRWGEWLAERAAGRRGAMPSVAPPPVRHLPAVTERGRSKIVFHTPFDMVAGGGERYLLTAAAALSEEHDVFLANEERYSSSRYAAIGKDLRVDTSRIIPCTRKDIARLGTFSLSVSMSNELLPPNRGFGRSNVYLCQFPFPGTAALLAERFDHVDTMSGYIAYSEFARLAIEKGLERIGKRKPVWTLYPPVELIEPAGPRAEDGPSQILSLGRFFVGGHNKRHDIAIAGLRALLERGVQAELHLVGTLHPQPEHKAHYAALRRRAEGLPVHFHTNASRDDVERLARRCSIYWHAAGYGVDDAVHPERCEHFGISIVEAMSSGCIPVVHRSGGPLEIVDENQTGFTYTSVEELAAKTQFILSSSSVRRSLEQSCIARAENYSASRFKRRWKSLVRDLL